MAIAMLLVQISPIKLDPWSELGKFFKWLLGCIGRAANSSVLAKLEEVTHAQQEAQKKLETLEARLDKHILTDARRDADKHRMEILQFNNTLLRNRKHTKRGLHQLRTRLRRLRACTVDILEPQESPFGLRAGREKVHRRPGNAARISLEGALRGAHLPSGGPQDGHLRPDGQRHGAYPI